MFSWERKNKKVKFVISNLRLPGRDVNGDIIYPPKAFKTTLSILESWRLAPVGEPYRASWSMKLSEGNIWNTWGSWTRTWQMEPVFGMFLVATWAKKQRENCHLNEKTPTLNGNEKTLVKLVFTLLIWKSLTRAFLGYPADHSKQLSVAITPTTEDLLNLWDHFCLLVMCTTKPQSVLKA